MAVQKGSNRKIGAKYEACAADYLKARGYRILERNYRNRCGEIDIIALDAAGSVLIYFEVKYRGGNRYGDPLEAVDARKQRRIGRAAALHYAAYGGGGNPSCRFDVIGIYADGSLCHIENAFDYRE